MTRASRAAALLALFTLLILSATVGLFAQQPVGAPNSVLAVKVEGNKVLSESAILINVKLRAGQPYSDEVVRDDVQRLLNTRRFDHVEAVKTPTDKGILVTFKVVERPLISDVQIVGDKSIKLKDLRALLTFGVGDAIDAYQIEAGRTALESKYHSDGFYHAAVAVDSQALKDEQKVVYQITEGAKAAVRKVSFEGNNAFASSVLKWKIKTETRFWPFISGAVDDETIHRDIEDLSNFYRDKGYLDVRIGKDLKFSPDKTKAEVVFLIEEGPRYRLGKTTFQGNTVYTDEEIRRYLNLAEGAYYDGPTQRRDQEKIRELYGEIGYLDTLVTLKRSFPHPAQEAASTQPGMAGAPAVVELLYDIGETRQIRIGRIDIRGNRITKMNVARRMLQFFPEQLWDTVAIEDTRSRMKETGLFDKITVTPFGEEEDVKNALVEVQEAKTGQFIVGAGVSSNAGLIGNITYTEKNFDISGGNSKKPGEAYKGAGQIFTISAEPGTEISRFHIDWREPYLNDKPYSLGARLYGFTAQREENQESRLGGQVSYGHMFSNRWYGELAARVEEVDISNLTHEAPRDVRDVKGWNNVDGLKGTLVRDRTDSIFLPSKGDRLSLSYEQVTGDFNFGKANADYHIYRTVYTDPLDRKHIWAGRVAAGDIIGDAPEFERFYGGGIGSIRGLRYRTVSPKQGGEHNPVGGSWSFLASTEYTYPLLANILRGVVFMDTGTVENDFGFNEYRASVGFGFLLQLPFFGPVPMELDLGFPVMKGDNDDTQIFNFNIGWTF